MSSVEKPFISVVSTLYRSSQYLDEFIDRCVAAAIATGGGFELILVDDGSPDDCLARAIRHAQCNPHIFVIELSRNFGHHAAILTGLASAKGERVFLIDSDLEEEPELLGAFLKEMDAQKADVVYGIISQQIGSVFRRVSSSLFWKIFNVLADTKTSNNICTVRLMNRAYLSSLLSLPEKTLFLGGLFAWPGFRQVPMQINKRITRSQSTYGLMKRVDLAVRSVVAFSAKPLYLISFAGIFISLCSAAIGLYFIFYKILFPSIVLSGFTTMMVSIWFLGGLILAAIGTVGLYLSHVYTEMKGRPRTIVRCIHNFPVGIDAGDQTAG